MHINIHMIPIAWQVNMFKVKVTTRLDMSFVYNGSCAIDKEEHFISQTSSLVQVVTHPQQMISLLLTK